MRRILIALLVLFCATTVAAAEEVIRNFISDVTVNTDGSLDVRETITVRAEGNEIKRGILRDFPTTYSDRNGVRVRVGFEVLGVERDGRDETYTVESISNGKRLKIGNADVFLDFGEHTYKITYRTTRQIGFFDRFDELYWNATGNGWTFPIERATAIIRLPSGAEIQQHAVYTGYQGQTGSDATVTSADGNRFEARTTRRLEASEGFTVAAGWQKGIVTPPTEAEKQRDWIVDNLGYFGLALTLLLVPLYYLLAWLKVGRDPPKGNIIPLFRPPEGMGPAGVRYVYKAGYDDKAFASAVVGLAVKHRMAIRNDDGQYTLIKQNGAGPALTRAETALYNATPTSALLLKQSNHASVIGMRSALESSLDDEFDGVMYLKNFKWFLLGFLLSVVGLVVSALLLPSDAAGLILGVGGFTTIWWGVILGVGFVMVKGLFASSGMFAKIRALMTMLFLIPFVGAGIAVPSLAFFTQDVSGATKWFVAGAVALMACNLIFFWLLKAPTQKGRAALDEIEGFRIVHDHRGRRAAESFAPAGKNPGTVRALSALCHGAGLRERMEQQVCRRTRGCRGGWRNGGCTGWLVLWLRRFQFP